MKYELRLTSLVREKSNGKSLLDELCGRFTYKNAEYWQDKVEIGEVLLNGEPSEANKSLVAGDEIEFIIPDFEEPDIDIDYLKVWENEHLLLVSKPAGLPVHSTKRFYFQTMTAVVRRNENNTSLNPLHRLDRETSGLMFYVKTKYAHRRLQKDFRRFLSGKYYLCLARGIVESSEFDIDVKIAEAHKPPVNYKMIQSEEGKRSFTHFWKLDTNNKFSLLLAKLNTGKKHQIRVHLELAGFPIVGDKLYSFDSKYFIKRCNDELNEDDIKTLGANNHLLHSFAMRASIPGESKTRLFYSFQFSEDFQKYLKLFPNWKEKAIQIIENEVK